MNGGDVWHGHSEFQGMAVSIYIDSLIPFGAPRGPLSMLARANPTPMAVSGDGERVGPLKVRPDDLYAVKGGFITVCARPEIAEASSTTWVRDLPKLWLVEAVVTAMCVSARMGKTVAAMLRCPSASYFIAPSPEAVTRIVDIANTFAGQGFAEVAAVDVAKTFLEPSA